MKHLIRSILGLGLTASISLLNSIQYLMAQEEKFLSGRVSHNHHQQPTSQQSNNLRLGRQATYDSQNTSLAGFLDEVAKVDTPELINTQYYATVTKGISAPYIWCQSHYGGYYDASGTTKDIVPGNRLREYGGKFADGSSVVTNVQTNNSAHIFWQPGLNAKYFWNP